MSEWCERASDWRSKWPSTLRVDFLSILPHRELRRSLGTYHVDLFSLFNVFEEKITTWAVTASKTSNVKKASKTSGAYERSG